MESARIDIASRGAAPLDASRRDHFGRPRSRYAFSRIGSMEPPFVASSRASPRTRPDAWRKCADEPKVPGGDGQKEKKMYAAGRSLICFLLLSTFADAKSPAGVNSPGDRREKEPAARSKTCRCHRGFVEKKDAAGGRRGTGAAPAVSSPFPCRGAGQGRRRGIIVRGWSPGPNSCCGATARPELS